MQKTITITPQVLKHSYLGGVVDALAMSKFIKMLDGLDVAGMETFKGLRSERDRGLFHLTVLSPKEFRVLRKSGFDFTAVPDFTVDLVGIGTVVDGVEQAWFVVAVSEQVSQWRASLGLPVKDLHVTVAFRKNDIHNKSKDVSTLIH